MFSSDILDKLLATSVLEGHISGAKVPSQAVYIPDIFSKIQFDYVKNYLNQNGYLGNINEE